MADDDASPSPPRPQPHQRTSSTASLGKFANAAAGQRSKTGKAHAVGKHNRNSSYGRNLNKLARLTGADEAALKLGKPRTTSTPSSSPSTSHVKRNKSEGTLAKLDSKVSIKKNKSFTHVRRNDSHPKLKKSSRPTTPREPKSDEESQLKGHAQPAFTIDDDDDENDEDEWTEESTSVSPIVTRNGSLTGPRPNIQPNGHVNGTKLPLVKPKKQPPVIDSPSTPVAEDVQALSKQQALVVEQQPLRAPDGGAITQHLLRRNSSQQLTPKLSKVSAAGSSGTQSPVLYGTSSQLARSQMTPSTPSEPSMPSIPSDGVSRFLDPTAASSSKNTYSSQTNLHSAMGQLRAHDLRSRSRSPSPGDESIRRPKSMSHLSAQDSHFAKMKEAQIQSTDDNGRTLTIDPNVYRRAGGNTQAKLDLWRTQSSVEPSAVPPAPLIRSSHAYNAEAHRYLGAEERRLRMAEEAEAELAFLRIYRNPAIEAIDRLRAKRKKEKAKKRNSLENERHPNGGAVGRSSKELKRPSLHAGSTPTDTPHGSAENAILGGAHGRRSVRFDVGGDGHSDAEELSEEGRLEMLLRSLWVGPEAEASADD